MIKLMCVNNPACFKELLTVGKIYQGEEDEMFYHSVYNDRGGNKDIYKKCQDELGHIPPLVVFIKLHNWREQRINEILTKE